MGKKKSWFTYVKTLFISEPKLKPEKKRKNSRPKFKHTSKTTLSNAEEDREKHAVAVATAAAAAAEAAIAAAKAATEVARLTNFSQELRRKSPHSAATKIQTCYKGYLARKALSALKGVVKLQAVVRGELARRSVIKKQTLLSLGQLRLHRSMIFEEKQNRATLGTTKLAQLKLRTAIEEAKEELIQRRRSFCSNKSRKDDISSYKSTSFPAYMATTESAKAKVKAKARQPLRLPGSYAWPDSPSKLSVSSWSSFKSEVIKPSKTNMSC